MKPWIPITVLLITVIAFVAYAGFLVFQSSPVYDFSINKASLFGDSFGVLSALFSALAFVMVVYTIALQQRELQLQREEMSKMASMQLRQLHVSLQTMAIECDDLANVWDDENGSEASPRQKKYINLILSHWETQFKEGLLTEEQINITLATHLGGNEKFRQFWQSARDLRKRMSDAGDEKGKKFYRLAENAYNSAGVAQQENSADS